MPRDGVGLGFPEEEEVDWGAELCKWVYWGEWEQRATLSERITGEQ